MAQHQHDDEPEEKAPEEKEGDETEKKGDDEGEGDGGNSTTNGTEGNNSTGNGTNSTYRGRWARGPGREEGDYGFDEPERVEKHKVYKKEMERVLGKTKEMK